jgi:sugar phosphate isomerase/epimerase
MPCYRGDLDRICAELSGLGYAGIELFVRRPTDLEPTTIRRTVSRHDLAVCQISTGQLANEDGLSLTHPDPDVRCATLERTREVIDLASELGAQIHVGRLRGNVPPGEGQNDAWRWMRDALAGLASYGEARAVRVLVEPQCRFSINNLGSVLETIDFLDSMGHGNLGILADTFHMNVEDVSLPASLMAAGHRLRHVHLADSNRQYPGAGHVNFREVIEALRLIAYSGFLTIEIEQVPDSPTAAARAARTIGALLEGI